MTRQHFAVSLSDETDALLTQETYGLLTALSRLAPSASELAAGDIPFADTDNPDVMTATGFSTGPFITQLDTVGGKSS